MTTPGPRSSFTAGSFGISSSKKCSKLYGRQQEQQALVRAYHSACPPGGISIISEQEELSESAMSITAGGNCEFVLISGKPGSGKTSLANTLRQEVYRDGGMFVSGKFEQIVPSEPYEVFASALTEYMNQLLDCGDQALIKKVRDQVVEAVGAEASVLTDVIPALKRLIGVPEPASPVYGSEGSNRFRFVFCSFVRALSKCSPLVLFLDDLQWANTVSTELIWSLLNTSDLSLMLIGAHRCYEDEAQPPSQSLSDSSSLLSGTFSAAFTALLRDIEKDETGIRISKLVLNDLSIDDIKVMVGGLLNKSVDETSVLAELVHLQSRGNIFYILQVLRLLSDQGVLTRNDQNLWEWDDEDIQTCLSAEGTIMDLIRRTIEQLPRTLQEALKVASCIGDEIDDSGLDMVLALKQGSVAALLKQAVDQGLLVFSAQVGGYRFSHDLIRQAAFEMIPVDERKEFHLKIGRRLWNSSNAMSRDKNIFVVVSLLSKGADLMKEERERYKCAELYHKAGEHALRLSAFHDASRYLQKGIELLGRHCWRDEYELSLSLYSVCAEVEVVNGNTERVIVLIKEVLDEARCLQDKLSVYCSLMRSMGQQDSIQNVISVGLDVLSQFGQPLPSKATRFVILKEFLRVRRALYGKSNEDLLNLPPMEDGSSIACMQILSLMFRYGYQAHSPYTVLVALRSVLLTLRFGVSSESAHAFAIYGLTLCVLGIDFEAGRRYGQVAVSLAERMRCKTILAKVHLVSAGAIRHWTEPIKDGLKDVALAAKLGMEDGDVETSLICRFYHDVCSMDLGVSLSTVEKDVLESIQQARAYRHASLATICSIALQEIHCYTGRNKNPARLAGSALDFDEAESLLQEIGNKSALFILYLIAKALAYAFGDFEFAGSMAERMRRECKSPSAFYGRPCSCFTDGMISAALARDDIDRRTNIKKTKSALRMMTRWAKGSPRSYLGKQKLLEAELLSLKKKQDASSAYLEAFRVFAKEGYTKNAALACERLADYKYMIGDENAAIESWNRAINLYDEWGATAKSKQLRVNGHMGGQSSQAITLEPQSSLFLECDDWLVKA